MDISLSRGYRLHKKRKKVTLGILVFLLPLGALGSLLVGTTPMTWGNLLGALGGTDPLLTRIIWAMRLPRTLGALFGGGALALSGTAIQCLLRNPLASPFTLGISHGAAFGASLAIFFGGTSFVSAFSSWQFFHLFQGSLICFCAFLGAMGCVGVIFLLATLRDMRPETLVLAGVALSSLALSGTMLFQYFADDLQMASMLFWTFGDVGRLSWKDIAILGTVLIIGWFAGIHQAQTYNVLGTGDGVAESLGISPRTCRFQGMLGAALLASVTVAFMGIIGFVGLMAPHLGKRLWGEDYPYLMWGNPILGGLLLLGADVGSRTFFTPLVVPVGVITAFLGAPLFLILVMRGD